MSQFEDFISLEMPRRPVMLTAELCGGYAGDPNDPAAPSLVQNAPKGTYYLQGSDNVLWQKNTGAPGTWVVVGTGGSTGSGFKSYATEILLLASTDPVGTGAYAVDTGNFFGRNVTGWHKFLLEAGGAFTISSFDLFPSISVLEVGDSLINPSFAASYSITPDTASIVDNQGTPPLDVSLTPTAFTYVQTYLKTAPGTSVLFTISAVHGVEPDSKTKTLTWLPRLFYGVGVDGLSTESDIEGLAGQVLRGVGAYAFDTDAGAGEHTYFAFPDSFGTPTFMVDGWEGGFDLVGVVLVTNAFGVAQDYQLWKTTNPALGPLHVSVSFA